MGLRTGQGNDDEKLEPRREASAYLAYLAGDTTDAACPACSQAVMRLLQRRDVAYGTSLENLPAEKKYLQARGRRMKVADPSAGHARKSVAGRCCEIRHVKGFSGRREVAGDQFDFYVGGP